MNEYINEWMPLRWSILMIPKFTFQSIQFLYFIQLISEVYKVRGLFKIIGGQSRSGWRTWESWDVDNWCFLCSQKVWSRPGLMEARCCVFLKLFNTHFFLLHVEWFRTCKVWSMKTPLESARAWEPLHKHPYSQLVEFSFLYFKYCCDPSLAQRELMIQSLSCE